MTTRALRSIYQFKVTLHLVQPVVWRRFQIVSADTLEDLHLALQIVMGWADCHLHEFATEQGRYGVPDKEFPSDIYDEADFRLEQVLKKEEDRLHYVYDFGDGWEHEVLLETVLPFRLVQDDYYSK